MDIPTLKYLTRYTGLNSIFDSIMQPQFSYYCLICWLALAFWLGPAYPTHCSCSSSLPAAYKVHENGKLVTFDRDF